MRPVPILLTATPTCLFGDTPHWSLLSRATELFGMAMLYHPAVTTDPPPDTWYHGARSLIISGGVACNTGLRMAAAATHLPYPVFFPTPGLATDNAAMIAAAAFPKLARGEFADSTLRAQANLALA